MRTGVLLLIFGTLATTTLKDYDAVITASSGNAVVLLVQDGCAPCRRLENDLIPILRQAGIMDDSSIHIISVNKQPQIVQQLQGSGLNSNRGFPVILVYRQKGSKQYGWRHVGYPGHLNVIEWLHGIKRWQPPTRST